MAYDADIRLIEDYVRVEVVGERRLGDAAHDAGEVGKDIVRFCRANDVFRVMVVLRLRGRLSAVDSYEMVVNSKSYGWTHNFRLAFVDTTGEALEDIQFTETVAVTRAYAVKAFADEASAAEWLREDPEHSRP